MFLCFVVPLFLYWGWGVICWKAVSWLLGGLWVGGSLWSQAGGTGTGIVLTSLSFSEFCYFLFSYIWVSLVLFVLIFGAALCPLLLGGADVHFERSEQLQTTFSLAYLLLWNRLAVAYQYSLPGWEVRQGLLIFFYFTAT